jgi:hypothetical protein
VEHCPICRAQLTVGDICRRCRADLAKVKQIARRSDGLAGAALHLLATGDSKGAARLLRRAKALRATPDIAWILATIAGAETTDAQRIDRDASPSLTTNRLVSP